LPENGRDYDQKGRRPRSDATKATTVEVEAKDSLPNNPTTEGDNTKDHITKSPADKEESEVEGDTTKDPITESLPDEEESEGETTEPEMTPSPPDYAANKGITEHFTRDIFHKVFNLEEGLNAMDFNKSEWVDSWLDFISSRFKDPDKRADVVDWANFFAQAFNDTSPRTHSVAVVIL